MSENQHLLAEVWSIAETHRYLSISRSHFYNLRQDPRERFPKPRLIGTKQTWAAAEVRAWYESRGRGSLA